MIVSIKRNRLLNVFLLNSYFILLLFFRNVKQARLPSRWFWDRSVAQDLHGTYALCDCTVFKLFYLPPFPLFFVPFFIPLSPPLLLLVSFFSSFSLSIHFNSIQLIQIQCNFQHIGARYSYSLNMARPWKPPSLEVSIMWCWMWLFDVMSFVLFCFDLTA